MEYKINKVINFRDDDGKIWSSLSPDKSVRLSIIPAKILSYLLENSKTIVKRNDLLDDIWNKNGLQASNNSLSQNISMLRKILQDMGADSDIIVTIPKVGLRIHESAIVEIEQGSSSKPDTAKDKPAPASLLAANKNKIRDVSIVVLIILSTFLILFFLQRSGTDNDFYFEKEQLYLMGNIDSCYVYTIKKHSTEYNEANMKIASQVINKHIPCIKNSSFIFQADDNKLYNDTGKVFISRCITSTPEGKTFSSCQDIYFNEYQ
ncbi:TPA: winged helix-turn-helix domain-containing protein [Morganella morganii]|uniref:winged helix-turn-helix domain-containing protein n=1 Tax=Morganella morganii TaxID=582 RepID=UPI00046A2DE9|nr:winged helix-turn-helix domain-containing protein [Morganella morganii]HDF2344467.1 winged helix-turn-helix domain-containing protein [Morganella morganii]